MHAQQRRAPARRHAHRAAATDTAAGPAGLAGFAALQRSVGNAAVARMMGHEEPAVQRSTAVHGVLNSPGRPLPAAVRDEAQARMGADFSRVRVHDDGTARASAADIGARAYTSGHHVVLGDGGGDAHTLYHELAHVVQQSRGPVEGTDLGDGTRMSTPGDRHERQADAWAQQALAQPASAVQRALADWRAAARPPEATPVPPGRPGPQQAVQRAGESSTGTKRTKDSPPPIEAPTGKRATRASGKQFNLDQPRLRFAAKYDGTKTQRLDAQQPIFFTQDATLSKPAGAPQATSTYYHFWQEVTDEWVSKDSSGTEYPEHRDWVQDGPYRPPYSNSVITNVSDYINFRDDPGFSGTASVEAQKWLESYSVSFRWRVAHATNDADRDIKAGAVRDDEVWTSPVVRHTMTSPFDAEAPVAVDATAAGERNWTVQLPARRPAG